MDVCIYRIREFIDYPICIYPKAVQAILIIVIPYGFVNFYPVEALLEKQDNSLPLWIADAGGIIIGLLLMILAYIFMIYIKKYQSTGS